jgi:hypothetical protein
MKLNNITMRLLGASVLLLIVSVDMGYRIYHSQPDPLTWYDLLLVVLIVFTLLGDRVSKLVLGLKGISIEQQVEAFQDDLKKIEAISSPSQSPNLEELMDESTSLKHNVWLA